MAGLSSPGIGSGLDINGLITKLMSVEQQPLVALAKKEASYQAKLTAFGSLKGALSALQTAAKTLATSGTYTGRSAGVSDPTVFSASADSTAAAGSYDITVSRLALAQQVHTNVNYGSDSFDSGTLRVTIGSGTPTDIVLSGTSTLADIRDAINGAAAGVTATIVNDGTADRLVLVSNTTGSPGAITLEAPVSNANGDRPLTDLLGANLDVDQAAQDALLTINKLPITRSSNTIADAIAGVTLNLLKADATTPPAARLTVTKDTSAIQSAVGAFVKAYNTARGQIASLTAYNSATKTASALTGDGTARNIQSELLAVVTGVVSGVGGDIRTLSDIGIAIQKDGTLALDSAKLTTALNDSSTDVASLFASTESGNLGLAVRFNTLLDGIVGSSGSISSRTEGISSSIKSIGKQRDILNLRLTDIEARYRKQFNALDSLLASMQSTSSYLTQQLAQIASLTPKSN